MTHALTAITVSRLPALAAACACCLAIGPARAADSTELWPELTGYYQLNERARASVDGSYALGKESDLKSLDLSANLDFSVKPIARRKLQSGDWQRSKYLWARIAYDRVFEDTNSEGIEVTEHRGIFALYGRVPLPGAVWLETRTRGDFRWAGDEYSERYRFRLDFTREFLVRNHTVVPYFNYEWFYDTRYNNWSRTLWTAGGEVTANEHFRYELYFARQTDRLPTRKELDALGVVLKWYY